MNTEARKTRGIFRGFINWAISYFGDAVPPEHQLEANLNTMVDALNLKADAASLSMALADQSRTKLQKAVSAANEFHTAAVTSLSEGDETAAQSFLVLEDQAKQEVARATAEYKHLQAEAERHSAEYARSHGEVEKRRRELPNLQMQARVIEAEEKIAAANSRYNLRDATGDFDSAVDKLNLRAAQVRNRKLLDEDPLEEARSAAGEVAARSRLTESLEKLRAEVDGKQAAGEGQPLQLEHNPLDDAAALLAAPRYAGLTKAKVLK